MVPRHFREFHFYESAAEERGAAIWNYILVRSQPRAE